MRHGPDPLIGLRAMFRRVLGYRYRYKLSARFGGVVRVHYSCPNEHFLWELTFAREEAELIAAWVASGATGPLPVLEYIESRWRLDYRWTAAAWRLAQAANVVQQERRRA